jgi:ABC-2 type transport system ATP-binding protein
VSAVIRAEDVGIEFYRSRKRKLSLREMIFKRGTTHNTEMFWAVRNATFEIGPGEAVGLVGANGSGKSTLLKMIAGVLIPDEGSVEVTQGVAPLIELTGGFTGDLTARDNIYLTAGLHGLSREKVDERFDEIVGFAGPQVRAALDTPFRHFSSGMQVRLGFSVITQLDEPIILVDEVLAVGDRKFRAQCHTRMENLLAEGRTLFLVSHSEGDLKKFCTRGLYMRSGELVMDGTIKETLEAYRADADGSGTGSK